MQAFLSVTELHLTMPVVSASLRTETIASAYLSKRDSLESDGDVWCHWNKGGRLKDAVWPGKLSRNAGNGEDIYRIDKYWKWRQVTDTAIGHFVEGESQMIESPLLSWSK